MRRLTLLLILTLAASLGATASTQPEYYSRWMSLTTRQLLDKGSHFAFDTGQADSALVCFSIVAQREHRGMSREETLDMIHAYNSLWHVYFYFYNYY